MKSFVAWNEDEARALLAPLADLRGGLLPALRELQGRYGCIAQEAIDLAADVFNLSRAEVYGVARYYDDFRESPSQIPVLRVCMAEACQALGARELKSHADAIAAGRVEVEEVFCLGNCACGPSVMAPRRVHGRVTVDRLEAIVDGLEGGGE